ncbi:MAG: precorrin-3B C(17)-methyltransferase, partial [Pseudomonadota bacterium]
AHPDAPIVLSVGDAALIYRRRRYALGLGCARGCPPEEMIGLVGRTLAGAGIAHGDISAVYSIDLKSDEAAVHAMADHLGVEARFFTPAQLERELPRLANPSDVVFAEVGCHGVAEGAALAACGPDGALVVEKTKSTRATCALARGAVRPPCGRARGRLAVIGIGPGAATWRTPEATRLIAEADELVGYGLYLDLLGPLAAKTPRKSFKLGDEEARCRYALEAAGAGRNVALISSGDAGIFAMGALVAELLDRPEDAGGVSAAARRVDVINVPGISALQAASARAGALLGHDFCAISLSDLLTPRAQILRRLNAAADGDFVIAFYNPVSRRRRTLLAEARRILLQHRPPDTPVLLASNLGRPEEALRRRTLDTLAVDEVDMLTVVLVGASQSRAFQTGDLNAGVEGWRMYTPRGYAHKKTVALSSEEI